jgi:hypothetical protein
MTRRLDAMMESNEGALFALPRYQGMHSTIPAVPSDIVVHLVLYGQLGCFAIIRIPGTYLSVACFETSESAVKEA